MMTIPVPIERGVLSVPDDDHDEEDVVISILQGTHGRTVSG
jgi:hypothetical protein